MGGDGDSQAADRDYFSGRTIEPLSLEGNTHVADLIDNVYANSGFNGRLLADGAALYKRMIENDATIALTLAGAMTPIGMSGVLNSLIEHGFVDVIISTGANLYHDLHRAYDAPMRQGSPFVDDNELEDQGIARIHDVYIHNDDTLIATDRIILDLYAGFDGSKPFSTAQLHNYLGKRVIEHAPSPEKSLLATAAKYDVPVYTSSPGDSSIGMNLIIPHLAGNTVNLNPILDVIETTALVRESKVNGVVIVGGGSPKNFYLQTQATLTQILDDEKHMGHDYILQLTTDAPHWGGLSGATPSEAQSWGKIKEARGNSVVVYSCASLTLPLVASYAMTRCKKRTPKRMMQNVAEWRQKLAQHIPAKTLAALQGQA
ncbi:MAG: deoxyhypusine synthase [Phycisphaerales bacterium]|nr:deoxyhypusine synthase [Phycisphaerales bacterium]